MDLIVGKFKKESSEILDDEIPRFAVAFQICDGIPVKQDRISCFPFFRSSFCKVFPFRFRSFR